MFTAPLTPHRYIPQYLHVCKLSACSTRTYKGAQIVQPRSVKFSFFTYNLAGLKVQSWLGPAAPPGGRGLHSRSPPPRLTPSSATPPSFLPLFNKDSFAHTPDQVLGTQRGPHRPGARPQKRGVQGRRPSRIKCSRTDQTARGRSSGALREKIAGMHPPLKRSLRKQEGRRGIERASVSSPVKVA